MAGTKSVNFGQKFKNPIHLKCVHIPLFLLTMALLPIILTIYFILNLIRSVLSLYLKKFRPDYGQFLSHLNSVIATGDCPYTNTGSNITYFAFTKGQLCLEEVREVVEKNFKNNFGFNQKLNGDPHRSPFIELTQELTTWMGFNVWKKESNFRIDDHVKNFDLTDINSRLSSSRTDQVQPIKIGQVIGEEEAVNLAHDLIKVPFIKGTSPWEILVYNSAPPAKKNNFDSKSLLIFRFSHALADGISIMTLLSHFVDEKDVYTKNLEKFGLDQNQKWRFLPNNPINFVLGIYDFIHHQLTTLDDNPWHLAENKELITERWHVPLEIPIETIKQITRVHGNVKFSTVLLTALTGSIKKFMTVHGIPVPQVIHVSTVVGQKRDPRWTCNNFGMVEVTLPTGLDDRCEVMREIEKNYHFLQTSSRVPRIGAAMMSFLGSLPKKMAPRFEARATTGLSTNVPSFEKRASWRGKEIECIQGVANLPSAIGVCLYSFGYDEKLSLIVGMGKDIMPEIESVRELVGYLKEEFNALLFNHSS